VARARATYIEDANALGSVPPPTTLSGAVKAGVAMLTGRRMQVLLDKLGERLAYERAGTRLYEAFLVKLTALGSAADPGMIDAARLIRDQEQAHFLMIRDCIQGLGGDPTAQTPGAAVAAVQGMGLVQAMTDARTDIPQCLNVLLSAELIDNAAWELLAELAGGLGQEELQEQFLAAAQAEAGHLATVNDWLRNTVMAEAGADID
jgi:hypothetical protein